MPWSTLALCPQCPVYADAVSASAPLRCPCFPPRSCTSGVCWSSEPCVLCAECFSSPARAGILLPRRHLLVSSVGQGTTDRPLGSPSGLLLHPLAMRLVPGIDPDSHLQGSWQSASERLKMVAAQVNDPGSNLHDHAAQHLDASARHPLRLAAERSFCTLPPCAPGLHPHGEPTPCSCHTAAAAVAGHSHPMLVDGGRAAFCRPPMSSGRSPRHWIE